MSRSSGVLGALTLIAAMGTVASAFAQCDNKITLVPLHAARAANKPREFVRFRYAMSASDSLLIRSREDAGTSLGPFDTGLDITRDGKTLQSSTLRNLPEFRREDPDFAQSFAALAVTRACSNGVAIYFVTMGYEGDETSAVLVFTIVPAAQGYEIATLPMIYGGVLDVSRANPLHLRTWSNLFEGICNACETAYEITEFEIQDGKPVRTRQYRTRRLYTSGDRIFDDRRRIRFIP